MSTVINGYRLTKELSNENAGMCQWGFAEKNGHEYFIKQCLKPKYPDENSKLAPALIEKMRQNATACYMKRKAFYDRLRECRTGNNVVVEEFFRFGNFYYAVTDRVRGPYLTVEQIAAMSEEKKRVLIRAILFNVMQFHDKGIVHSDLKPDNIMVRSTTEGYCTAKIIDFDSGFFSYDPPPGTRSISPRRPCCTTWASPSRLRRRRTSLPWAFFSTSTGRVRSPVLTGGSINTPTKRCWKATRC